MRVRWPLGPLLTLLLVAASCTGSPEAEPDGGRDPDADGVELGAEAGPGELPPPFEVVSMSETARRLPRGATESGFIALVGDGPDDPRFLEVSFLDFDRPADLAEAGRFVGRAQDVEPTELPTTGMSFGFVPDGGVPGQNNRSGLELSPVGPPAHSVFRGLVGPRSFAVGAANTLQPPDIDSLLPIITGPLLQSGEVDLPAGLRVLVDQPLAEGLAFEVETGNGIVVVEVRDDVPRGWFDYLTWDDPQDPAPTVLAALGVPVSVAPPEFFNLDGDAVDDARTAFWSDDRLISITTPPEFPEELTARLYTGFRDLSAEQLEALGAGLEPVASADEIEVRAGRPAPPPTEAEIRELQGFVESARGIEAGRPLAFEFVDDLAAVSNGLFVSAELWSVLRALDLVLPGQTREEADEARTERVRGVPGAVILQEDTMVTNLVIVHEMTHMIDPVTGADSFRSAEPVLPGQALVEGNAHRVAYEWADSLEPDDRAAIPPHPGIFAPGGDPRLSPASQNAIEFPYDEGHDFAVALAELDGEATIAEAFARPPISSEQILFIDAWVDDDRPVAVPVPDQPEGSVVLEQGTLGAFMLLLTIEDPLEDELLLPPDIDGRAIVQHWAGDSYLIYETNDRSVCLAASVEMDTEAAADDLAAALGHRNRTLTRPNPTTVDVLTCS